MNLGVRGHDGASGALGTPPGGAQNAKTLILTLAMFHCLVSAVIAAEVYAVRYPMGSPSGWSILFYWVVTANILGAIVTACARPAGADPIPARIVSFFLFGVAASIGAGLFPPFAWVAALATTTTIIWFITRSGWHLGSHFWIVLPAHLLRAVVLGSGFFLFLNAIGSGGVFLQEKMFAGLASSDTYFHTSIASMISQYGVVTTGLDGLTPVISYHVLSHFWFGMLAKGAGVSVVTGYYLAVMIVALPLLLFGLSFATLSMTPRPANELGALRLAVVPIAILFVIDCFDWMSYLKSESHLVGLLFFLIGLPLLKSIALADRERAEPGTLLLAAVFGLVAAAAKISIGVLWLVALAFIVLRARKYTIATKLLVIILIGLETFIISLNFQPNDNIGTTYFYPFHFFLAYSSVVAAINIGTIGLAVIMYVRDVRRSRDRLWAEAAIFMMCLSMLPSLTLRIDGGSAYYFLNVGTWIAIVSLAGRLISATGSRLRDFVAPVAMAVIAVAIFATPHKANSAFRLKLQRNAIYAKIDPRGNNLRKDGFFSTAALTALAQQSEQTLGAKVKRLLDKNGVSAGDSVLIFVPPSFQGFWASMPYRFCRMPSFLIPAGVSVPLLQGLPPMSRECNLGTYYGFTLVDPGAHSEGVDDASLCSRAVKKGFPAIVILNSETEARRVECD